MKQLPATRQKNQHLLRAFLVALFLAMITFAAGSLWVHFQGQKTESVVVSNTNVVTVNRAPIETKKTYTSSRYDFSIIYPADWSPSETIRFCPDLPDNESCTDKFFSIASPRVTKPPFISFTYKGDIDDAQSLDAWRKKIGGRGYNTTWTINDIPAAGTHKPARDEYQIMSLVNIKTGGAVIQIQWYDQENPSEVDYQVFHDVLESLKHVES